MANSSFTPQQVEEFLQEFFDVVGTRQYTGARYVPIFGRAGSDTIEWDDGAPYEPLTVVMHEGVSYVSRRYVPTGIDIGDTAYWAQTYRFDAQVEQYMQMVRNLEGRVEGIEDDYVPFPVPPESKYGEVGQVLGTNTDGTTVWQDPVVPSDEQAERIIDAWLDDHPEATTTVEDGSITTAKLASGAVTGPKVTDGTITDDKLANGTTQIKNRVTLTRQTIDQSENNAFFVPKNVFDMTKGRQVSTTSSTGSTNYYRISRNLVKGSTYVIEITVPTAGTYLFQMGTAASAGSMVDTLGRAIVTGESGGKVYIYGYTPSFEPVDTYWYYRCDQNVQWDAVVYECRANLASFSLNAAEFQAAPYNSLLANLPRQTVFFHAATYGGLDLPPVDNANVMVMTLEGLNPTQVVITRTGQMFIRMYYWSSWQAWHATTSLRMVETDIEDTTAYQSFNDLPIGSIVRIASGVDLADRPSGSRTAGHGGGALIEYTGTYDCVVTTYANKPDAPTAIVQTCVFFNAEYSNYAQTSTRYGVRDPQTHDYVWSDWSTVSQDSMLHATNRVVDINSYSTFTFGDFNDAPGNTMYQVDLNTGTTVLNNPAPGRSGMLVTLAWSVSSRHALVQMHFALYDGYLHMFIRYGYLSGGMQWTPWREVTTEALS